MDAEQQNTLGNSKSAGVCLHLTSLPGPHGIGEIGRNAFGFIEKMRQMELSVWQFLPTGPTAYGDSPYQPLSTFAGNELLIETQALIDDGLLRKREADVLAALPHHQVDYGRLIPAKTALLRSAAARFPSKATSAVKSACDTFMAEHDDHWLHDYAMYRVLKTRHGERSWPDWEPQYVHRDESALRALQREAATDIEAIKVTQFLFHSQWQELRDRAAANDIRLFGDMPIYIALDSADAWAHPELLQIDTDGRPTCVAGVPPDYFSEDGQLWGNPLYAWDTHAADGYQWWIERLRAAMQQMDMVRIDHFRGFEAYWSIPADSENARNGEWVTGPNDAVFDAMQAALGNVPVVAEDLGVITAEVEALRDRHNMPGMAVLQFAAAEPDFNADLVRENCVCYTGTHDNDTTVGWFEGSPTDARNNDELEQLRHVVLGHTGGSRENIHTDLIRLAFSTDARLAIAPLQDYLGLDSEARFNTPGVSNDNWRWRVESNALDDHFCKQVAELVAESGRGQQDDE